jgi:nitrile hydratase beta subunit
MNSIHDMGGMDGFGPVIEEVDEPAFHAPWEGRVYGINRVMGYAGAWVIDESRASIEALDPVDYLRFSYYKKWFAGIEQRLIERGYVGTDEIAAGKSLRAGKAIAPVMTPAAVSTMKRADFGRPPAHPAKFKPGDLVQTRNLNPVTHTRLPRYARDKCGIVEAVRGCHVYPDTVAIGQGEQPQWLYTVVFSGRELWGADADPSISVSIEAFEPYLMPA